MSFYTTADLHHFAGNYFGLRASLASILKRAIDLMTTKSLKNAILIEEIDRTKKQLYAA